MTTTNILEHKHYPTTKPQESYKPKATKSTQETDNIKKGEFQKVLDSRTAKVNSKEKIQNNGTDFALKDLSKQMEAQILGTMWNLAFEAANKEYEGGLGEEIFHKELVNEMLKSISDKEEMGDIAQNIYNDLTRDAK